MANNTELYVSGNRAPVAEETTAFDLEVTGQVPADLNGRWLRNGPNPLPDTIDPETFHWFLGDGMVHGVCLGEGKAKWYRNRFVRSAAVSAHFGEGPIGGPRFGDREFGPNTNVGAFAGKTWAMVEAGGTPVELDYELNSLRFNDFEGTLQAGFSAHPKYDPATGEMHAMTYAWPDIGHLQYVVVGPEGKVTKTVDVPVTDFLMVHDMSLTDRYAVVYDLPVTVDLTLDPPTPFPFRWNATRDAQVGLLPRNGDASEIIWCPVNPCYVFHPMNAYDTPDGKVVLDVVRYDTMFHEDVQGPFGDSRPMLWRWTVDPVAKTVHEEQIYDRAQEFPRHNNAVGGKEYRYGYAAELGGVSGQDPWIAGATLKVDHQSGAWTEHDHGAGRGGAEPIFVAREGSSAEDDGYLLVSVYDAATDKNDLVILDAANMAAAPLAKIHIPARIPDGFHGNWSRDS